MTWQEHMWPVFSYKCVLSSWMGMHRVRYKLPGQLKSAFSPATPPGSLRTDPDVRLTNEHLVPDFPPFIIIWSLPVSEESEAAGICESNCETNWQVTKYLPYSLRLIIDLWMIPPFLWISIARKFPEEKDWESRYEIIVILLTVHEELVHSRREVVHMNWKA